LGFDQTPETQEISMLLVPSGSKVNLQDSKREESIRVALEKAILLLQPRILNRPNTLREEYYDSISISKEHCLLFRRVIDQLLKCKPVPLSEWSMEEVSTLRTNHRESIELLQQTMNQTQLGNYHHFISAQEARMYTRVDDIINRFADCDAFKDAISELTAYRVKPLISVKEDGSVILVVPGLTDGYKL
jgi:hypothetical protein